MSSKDNSNSKKRKAAPSRAQRQRKRRKVTTVTANFPDGSSQTIRGRGSYSLSDVTAFAPAVGAGLGGLFGPAGAMLGTGVGSAVDKLAGYLTGRGQYKVNFNSIVNPGQTIPGFEKLTDATRLRHRELVATIVEPANNAGTFINRVFHVNAALPAISWSGGGGVFPWGSSIACNYQQWKPLGMVFMFVSRASPINNSATGGLGLGMGCMASNYDSLDAPYESMAIMQQSQYAVSFPPSANMMHEIECEPSLTSVEVLYTREAAVPTSADIRFYDLCTFQFATQGLPNSTSDQLIGELWVTYDIGLVKPLLSAGLAGMCVIGWKWQLPIATVASAGGAYLGNPATAAVLMPGSTINAPTLGNTGIITFPPGISGKWKLTYIVGGASTALAAAMDVTLGSNILSLNVLTANTSPLARVTAGATATYQIFEYFFSFKTGAQSGNTLQLTTGTLPTAIVGADLIIEQINSDSA